MGMTCSDFLLQRLIDWGVSRIYGSPRDGINGILGALARASEFIDFVQVPLEEMAGFMACVAAMGPGVAYRIAAKFAFPDRVAIAPVGNGTMQMNGNNCLLTISHYWRRWKDQRLIVIVLKNWDLNQVTWEQRILAGNPKFPVSQELPACSYAAYAELCGLRGLQMDQNHEIGELWGTALASNRPVVIDAYIDTEVACLPPHITLEQAKHYWQAIFKGDPDSREMVRSLYAR